MLKKLSLAIAFLGSPRVIILDEPLITLDEHARQILLSLIKEYNESKNVTFLLSSHQVLHYDGFQFQQIFQVENKTLISTKLL